MAVVESELLGKEPVTKMQLVHNLVSEDFVERMKRVKPPTNAISEFTFYRTYSRFNDILGRRETWLEASIRAAEYSVSLAIRQMKKAGIWIEEIHFPQMKKEAEVLATATYMLQAFPSGRTLYTGGSPAAELYPLSNFNCSSAVIDEFKKIGEMFYLLMVGTGFGFRILKSDVAKLPAVRRNVKIIHKEYVEKAKEDRFDTTVLVREGNTAILEIGDSKEGWRYSIDTFFAVLTDEQYNDITTLIISYDNIRPKGERLKTFGGTASGPNSMKNMFTVIDKVLKDQLDERIAPLEIVTVDGENEWVTLRPIHLLDICNAVAYNVVSGGVRRSAQICLFSQDDYEVMFAKYGLNGLWGHKTKETYDYLKAMGSPLPDMEFIYDEEVKDWTTGEQIPHVPGRSHLEHRRMSNNSALYYAKPDRKTLHMIVKLLETEGEPGFVNAEEALRRFPWFHGVNPCVEILLDDRGLCNLSTIPVINHVRNGVLDRDSLMEAARISARIGVRMTTIDLELPEWDEKQKKHRLTGCSLTGWQDMIDAVGMTKEEERELLRELRRVTKEEAIRYAAMLRVPAPHNTTAIKPEGTQSILAGGVSSGLHFSHAPFFFRRIRVSATDPLCQAVEHMGWKVENEVGQGITYTDPKTGEEVTTEVSTKVLTFPLKSPAKRTKDDISVEEQFDIYFNFQENYTDQNTSNTITVKGHEWPIVEEILWNRWDEMLAVSFLALDGGTYQLAPYEAIRDELDEFGNVVKTAEQIYEEAVAAMPDFDPMVLEFFETSEEFDIGNDGCDSGNCPIR